MTSKLQTMLVVCQVDSTTEHAKASWKVPVGGPSGDEATTITSCDNNVLGLVNMYCL